MAVKIKNPVTVVQSGGDHPVPPVVTPLDPVEVYNDTRPADWLTMPTIGDEENDVWYFLLMVPSDRIDDVEFGTTNFSNAGAKRLEFGTTDSSGNFTADDTLTVDVTSSSTVTISKVIPISSFGNVTADGYKQLMCKLSHVSGSTLNMTLSNIVSAGNIYEISYKSTHATSLFSNSAMSNVRYISIYGNPYANPFFSANFPSLLCIPKFTIPAAGSSPYFSPSFKGCSSLIALPQLDLTGYTSLVDAFSNCSSLEVAPIINTSQVTNWGGIFSGCSSLKTVNNIDFSGATSLSHTFSGCSKLITIPAMDFSHVTNLQYTFQSCVSLKYLPPMDLSSCTAMNNTFSECAALDEYPLTNTGSVTTFASCFASVTGLVVAPMLDTSGATNISYMFSACTGLKEVPLYDTSNVTNFAYAFSQCSNLKEVPLLNTSSGTNFTAMFNQCSSLSTVPLFNTSSATSMSNMFYQCARLSSVPAFSTSNVTNFGSMFNNCKMLNKVPDFNTSSATSMSNMFYACSGLKTRDFSGFNFSSITGTSNLSNFLYGAPSSINCGTILLEDTFGNNGITNTATIVNYTGVNPSPTSTTPVKIKINTDRVIPLAANASTLFSGGYTYIYVPDDMLTSYQADTKWSTLNTRLKSFSDWTA